MKIAEDAAVSELSTENLKKNVYEFFNIREKARSIKSRHLREYFIANVVGTMVCVFLFIIHDYLWSFILFIIFVPDSEDIGMMINMFLKGFRNIP